MAEAPRTPLGGLPAMPQSSDFMDTDTDLEFYGVPTFSASPGNLADAASAGRAAKPRGADRRVAPSVLARTHQLPPRSPARQLARSPRLRRHRLSLCRSEPDGAACQNVHLHLMGQVLDEAAAAAAAPLLPPLGGRLQECIEMIRRYEPPSIFLTVAPDDVHSPLGIRLSIDLAGG